MNINAPVVATLRDVRVDRDEDAPVSVLLRVFQGPSEGTAPGARYVAFMLRDQRGLVRRSPAPLMAVDAVLLAKIIMEEQELYAQFLQQPEAEVAELPKLIRVR